VLAVVGGGLRIAHAFGVPLKQVFQYRAGEDESAAQKCL
jgi:hypothetical protein